MPETLITIAAAFGMFALIASVIERWFTRFIEAYDRRTDAIRRQG